MVDFPMRGGVALTKMSAGYDSPPRRSTARKPPPIYPESRGANLRSVIGLLYSARIPGPTGISARQWICCQNTTIDGGRQLVCQASIEPIGQSSFAACVCSIFSVMCALTADHGTREAQPKSSVKAATTGVSVRDKHRQAQMKYTSALHITDFRPLRASSGSFAAA